MPAGQLCEHSGSLRVGAPCLAPFDAPPNCGTLE